MAEFLKMGARAFKEREYGEASKLFESQMKTRDAMAPMVCYKYAVSALFEVLKDEKCEDKAQKLDVAENLLKDALDCLEDNVLAQDRIDILTALGEISSTRGNLDAKKYFFKALSLLEPLAEVDSPEVAYINFRLFSCYAKLKSIEAIPYCIRAISICRRRQIRLARQLLSLSNHQAIEDTEAEIQTLISHRSFYLMKLDDFRYTNSKQSVVLQWGKLLVASLIFGLEFTSACFLKSENLGTKVAVLVLNVVLIFLACFDCILTGKDERERGATWQWGRAPPCLCLHNDDGSVSCNFVGIVGFCFALFGLISAIVELTRFATEIPEEIQFDVWPVLYALAVVFLVLHEMYKKKIIIT